MNIAQELQVIFSDATTPGDAINRLIELKRAGVTWDAVLQSLMTTKMPSVAPSTPKAPTLASMKDNYIIPFGKYKGTPISEVPTNYLTYALDHFDALRDDTRERFQAEVDSRNKVSSTTLDTSDDPYETSDDDYDGPF